MAKQLWLPPATSRSTSRRTAAAHADYAKRSFKRRRRVFKTGERQIQEAIEIRSEYTKMGYETFVADSKRIAEVYNELSRSR
jgi:hypothetical protein